MSSRLSILGHVGLGEVMFGTVHKLLDVVHEYMTIQVKHARVPNNALFLSIEKII